MAETRMRAMSRETRVIMATEEQLAAHRASLGLLTSIVNAHWAEPGLTPVEQEQCHVAALGIIALRRLVREGERCDG